jgi:FtsP/CotA-like multicopper oxidase with cupredoxin domain
MKRAILKSGRFLALMASGMWLAAAAFAATPGITGTTFNLTAQQAFLNQPDGESVYSWGYGCATGFAPAFLPAGMPGATCPTMQVPGPTLIVTEGNSVTVNLTNQLPTAAGNTSILFPGFTVTATGGTTGLLTQEAAPGTTVTYTFTASSPGTHPYYSGTQGDLQIEMGLYGAIVVLPASIPANCTSGYHALNTTARGAHGETDFRLAAAAYDHPGSCYDREYLFQWAEMDSRIHRQALAQVTALTGCTAGTPGCSLNVQTEPYHPAYYLINGRSMPDLMDPNFAGEYPHQPYNANPHMHMGELTLIRTIGQGRWQHPFHEHANHVRILARDGNLELSGSTNPVSFTSGLASDAGRLDGRWPVS